MSFKVCFGAVFIFLDLVSSISTQQPLHDITSSSEQRSPTPLNTEEKQFDAYLAKFNHEIDFSGVSEFIGNSVNKEFQKGNGKHLKDDKEFHEKLFKEIMNKKIFVKDKNVYKKEIKEQFMNGTLSDNQVENIFDKLVDKMRKNFYEALDYRINNQHDLGDIP